MDQDPPVIEVVVPRDELPDDEPIQLVLDDHQKPCTWRIRADTPISHAAGPINDLTRLRIRRAADADVDVDAAECQ